MTSSRPLLLLVAVLAAVAAFTQARAAPLDADTCNKLKIEQGELEHAGAEQSMAKGPEWAKANLTPEKLQQVRRFIELEELILFRCRGKTLVTIPHEPEGDQNPQNKGHDKAGDKRAKDAQDGVKGGKQETVVSKTLPHSAAAKAKAPAAAAKVDPKPKAQAATRPAAQPKKAGAAPSPNPEPKPSGTARN